jgi:hypothetical protein
MRKSDEFQNALDVVEHGFGKRIVANRRKCKALACIALKSLRVSEGSSLCLRSAPQRQRLEPSLTHSTCQQSNAKMPPTSRLPHSLDAARWVAQLAGKDRK